MLRNDMFSTRLWILTSIQRAGFEVFFLRQYVVIQNFAAIVLLEYMYIYMYIMYNEIFRQMHRSSSTCGNSRWPFH